MRDIAAKAAPNLADLRLIELKQLEPQAMQTLIAMLEMLFDLNNAPSIQIIHLNSFSEKVSEGKQVLQSLATTSANTSLRELHL